MSHSPSVRYPINILWKVKLLDQLLCSFFQVYATYTLITLVEYSYSTTSKMHLFLKLFILLKRSTCFGRSFRPSSGAQNCTYGNKHMSNSCCYLLLAAGSSSCLTYSCCRMCSFELLMMDGKTV